MLVDQYQRKISYLRLSVTDRCDFRCQYCMSEDIEFMPKQQMLTIEEMTRLSQIFINLGITKIRLTGGEPLVRRGIDDLIVSLGKNKKLKELTLTKGWRVWRINPSKQGCHQPYNQWQKASKARHCRQN